MLSVSIIIPAWNETGVLEATLQALLDACYNKSLCEVIVVAGGDDGTYQLAQDSARIMSVFSRYIVILQAPLGKNAAIQQGIKQAKNEVIVLLDADTTVDKRTLKNMADLIEQGSCDLAIANPKPVKRNWVSDYYMISKAYLLDKIRTFSGHLMAFKASIVRDRLQYFFDTEIKVGTDYFLAQKFMEQGQRVLFVKGASVTTHLPSSLKYFIRCELRWLRAFIDIGGVSYRTLVCNTAVVLGLISLIPLSKIVSGFALLFNIIYMTRRSRMFLIASRHYDTNIRSLFGFLVLSYLHHVIGFIAYAKYFLGLPKEKCLYQGQRY